MTISLIGFLGTVWPEDLSGYKLVPYGAITNEEIQDIGANSTPLAVPEIYIALITGIVDGVAVNNTHDRTNLLQLLGDEFEYTELDAGPESGPTNGPDDLLGTENADIINLKKGQDIFSGLDGADEIRGGAGGDRVFGNGGADTIWGGAGGDFLKGGTGADRLFGGNGSDTVFGGAADDELDGGNGSDQLFGDDGNDTLDGGDGNDELRGADGFDILIGGAGNDDLFGEGDNDDLSGEEGADKLIGGKGNDLLKGNSGSDTLNGGNGADDLRGGKGNDTLNGGKGSDVLSGGRGNDALTGGTGADVFVFEKTGVINKDTVTDFDKGADSIRVNSGDFSLTETGGNVVLKFGAGEKLTLEGVSSKDGITIEVEGETPGQGISDPALVFGLGGKFDLAYNQSAYEGAEKWALESGLSYRELEIQSEAQREQALSRMADVVEGPVVAVGWGFYDALETVAPQNPDVPFAIIDSIVDQPNVSSYTFSIEEGAYLAGLFAAMASETGTVGFIGGMDIPFSRQYSTAFEQGALDTDPTIDVLIHMTGSTPAAWNDPVKGSELATLQMANGADVIFSAAGGTSLGVFQAVADAGALSIGADFNQNYLHPGSMLTSIVNRVDRVVEDIFTRGEDVAAGVHEVGLAEGMIDYAYDDNNKTLLTKSMRDAADLAIDGIIAGQIIVDDYLSGF